MNDDRRLFVHRVAWAILPGFLSGLIVAGAAYGAIKTELRYLAVDISEIRKKNQLQDQYMQRTREIVYQRRYDEPE